MKSKEKNQGFFCPSFMKTRKGSLLTENIVFILLNLAFLTILILFIFLKTQDPAILEEKYSKQIALMVDAARPGMFFSIDMKDALDTAKKENWPRDKILDFKNNVITVKLRKKGEYSYSYFNDVVPVVDFLPDGRVEIKIKEKT